jgi:hypothetical protein
MDVCPLEANSRLGRQKIPRLSLNLKVHCRVHKSLSVGPSREPD